jgi:hypothetical protein
MVGKPQVIDANGKSRTLPNLQALRAISPKTYPRVVYLGKTRVTKAFQKNLPTHGGWRHGVGHEALTNPGKHCGARPEIKSRRPAQPQERTPRVIKAGWELRHCSAHVINLRHEWARREATMHDLKDIGFLSMSVFRAVDGANYIKAVTKAGRFFKVHMNDKGRDLIKAPPQSSAQ